MALVINYGDPALLTEYWWWWSCSRREKILKWLNVIILVQNHLHKINYPHFFSCFLFGYCTVYYSFFGDFEFSRLKQCFSCRSYQSIGISWCFRIPLGSWLQQFLCGGQLRGRVLLCLWWQLSDRRHRGRAECRSTTRSRHAVSCKLTITHR